MVSVEQHAASLKVTLDPPTDAPAARSGSLSEPVSCGSSVIGCPGGSAETKGPGAALGLAPSSTSSSSASVSASASASATASASAAPSSAASSSSSAAKEEVEEKGEGEEDEEEDPVLGAFIRTTHDVGEWHFMIDDEAEHYSVSFRSASSLSDTDLSHDRYVHYLMRIDKPKLESLEDFLKMLYILIPGHIERPLSELHTVLSESEQASEDWLDFYEGFLAPLPLEFLVFVFWFPRRWPYRFRVSQDPILRRLRETIANKRMVDLNRITLDNLPYPHGDWSIDGECVVCFGNFGGLTRLCCGRIVCEGCRQRYFVTSIEEGRTSITCPACQVACSRIEVNAHLPKEAKDKLSRFLVDANKDPNRKTCPNCCHITERPSHNLSKKQLKHGLNLTCERCELEWCFNCQAPKHTITCKKFTAGDVLLRQWAKHETSRGSNPKLGNRNARRCPGCKVFIHRYDGCPEMRCSMCGEVFCYACGKSMRRMYFIGNHTNRLSVLGCKKRLFPNNTPLRWLVRGSILVSGLLLTPFIIGGVTVAALVVLPVTGVRIARRRWRLRKSAFAVASDVAVNWESWDDLEASGRLSPHEEAVYLARVHSEDHLTRL